MDAKTRKLIAKRARLLREIASLRLLAHGSLLERFSTCSRKNCACHQGKKHGPRFYVVVYRDGKQRQVYVPKHQVAAIKRGLQQDQRAQLLMQEVSDINLKLMRDGLLEESLKEKKEGEHQ